MGSAGGPPKGGTTNLLKAERDEGVASTIPKTAWPRLTRAGFKKNRLIFFFQPVDLPSFSLFHYV
ncbi:hypothetical protein SCARR_02329 [Pontiella sulfatireligans]|uniref:Uncharacterized protein n=1 Tax=Pontiella sulfatireligans TaxID=2750658 RepID=A0A6C2UJJ2_9BACT|nr:hypothetical protein SCARR_02329 [Pontiella sulfatireligans]